MFKMRMITIFFIIAFSPLIYGQVSDPGIITTIAGNGIAGYSGDGGLATDAQISCMSVIVDQTGNIYFVDSSNLRVRKIDTSGIIKTIVGTGSRSGNVPEGVPAEGTPLGRPSGLDIDKNGNLFISDELKNHVRMIDTMGIIFTVVGNGLDGIEGDNLPALSAKLNTPFDVIVDDHGNIFIADYDVHRIRKVDTSGIITTVAGNGSGGFSGDGGLAINAQLSFPTGIDIDRFGNLLIIDSGNSRIRKVDTSGIITTIAGNGSVGFSGDEEPAINAQFNFANGVRGDKSRITVDNEENIYITDTNNHRIRVINALGIINTIAGNGTAGYSGDGDAAYLAELNRPMDVFTDSTNNLYIADTLNRVIRKVTFNNQTQTNIYEWVDLQ